MIMSGYPNRPFPDSSEINVVAITEGGKQAIELVSGYLASGEFSSLEDLVSSSCIAGLKTNLNHVTEEERKYLAVNSQDIFFSFITKVEENQEEQSLVLVTFSLPGLTTIKQYIASNREKYNNISEQAKEGKLDAEQIRESLSESMSTEDPNKIFQSNEILIGNYTFRREDKGSEWTIVDIAQINSVTAWAWIFRKRWKGRLGLSLRGTDFHKILRYDYMTDWIAYILFFNLFILGGTVGGPTGN